MVVNYILTAVLLIVIGAAVVYLIKAKKRGVKCVGCPYGEECANRGKCGDGCGCPTTPPKE